MTTMVRSKRTRYVSGHCAVGNHEQCIAVSACRCSECTHSTYVPREVSLAERAKLDRIKADLDAIRREPVAVVAREPVAVVAREPVTRQAQPVTRQAQPVNAPEPAAPVPTPRPVARYAHAQPDTPQAHSGPATAIPATASAVRAWAVANGWIELAGQRGRLPLDALAAYRTAHGSVQSTPKATPSTLRVLPPVAFDSLFALPPATEIRAWAVANGWPNLAGQRVRVPKEAIQAFVQQVTTR